MIETTYRLLGKFFHHLWAFFAARAEAMEEKRMTARYCGRTVRLVCKCHRRSRAAEYEGTWRVEEYTEAGDLRLVRPGRSLDALSALDDITYVPPGHVEVLEDA